MILNLQPRVLRWARERASFQDAAALAGKLKVPAPDVEAWETTGRLTMNQMQRLATITGTPEGMLFLPSPPLEKLPVPDFRTVGSGALRQVSPELLDTLHDAQRKQDWYREYLVSQGGAPVPFVGSITVKDTVASVSGRMRSAMGLDTALRAEAASLEEALRAQVAQIEAHGVLVLRNGVVGCNTRRKLSVSEFRGFALSDPYAPLIFINGGDAPAGQMFTLAHELAHIWLGVSGVSNTERTYADHNATERFCNEVAAELLVPAAEFQARYAALKSRPDRVRALGKHFRVSSLVILRRLLDLGHIDQKTFQELYKEAEAGFQGARASKESGGDFYRTEMVRVSPTFARALLESTLEGRTPWRDACNMLGVSKAETVHKMAQHLELIH